MDKERKRKEPTSLSLAPVKPAAIEPFSLEGYAAFLDELKVRIRTAQVKAALAVNRELIMLYWDIGCRILEQQKAQGWGAKVIERLALDLLRTFPGVKGFSSRNLKYMRAFAEAYPNRPFVQQTAAQIPWFHNCAILDKITSHEEREFYIHTSFEYGWSRNVLVHQIESGLYERQGKAQTNFEKTLPSPQSDLARQALKDPYVFDFLMMDADARERELEQGLLEHIQRFLLELGVGFAFVGRQIHLEVGGEDFYMDLLFYHLGLRCFVVVELKAGSFKPEYAGKMNFYLSAVDDLMRRPDDQPTIGLILCKTKNRMTVEYALRDIAKPMGVSAYKLMRALPKALKGSLPTIEEIEAELSGEEHKENT